MCESMHQADVELLLALVTPDSKPITAFLLEFSGNVLRVEIG